MYFHACTGNIPFLVFHTGLVKLPDTSHARTRKDYCHTRVFFEVRTFTYDRERYTETELIEFKGFLVLWEYTPAQERSATTQSAVGDRASYGVILRNKVGFRQL